MDLGGADFGEPVKGLVRQRRRAVLDGAGQPVLRPGRLGQLLQGLEIQFDLGHRPVRQRHAAVGGPRLHAHLADALDAFTVLFQLRQIAVHEGAQLLHGAVLAAHLADLAAHGDRHAGGLQVPNHDGQLRRQAVVELLLLPHRGLAQVHERGGVHVDIVEAGIDRLPDQVLDRLDLRGRIGGELLCVHLEMVALEKQRPPVSRPDGRRRHRRRVFLRALLRIVDLGTGDLEDHGPDRPLQGGPQNGLSRVVGEGADVDGRHGETLHLFAAHRLIQRLDRSGQDADSGAGPPDEPAGGPADLFPRAEDRGINQVIDERLPEPVFIQRAHVIPPDLEDAVQTLPQLIHGFEYHRFLLIPVFRGNRARRGAA